MSEQLPPDLSRIGDQLVRATERRVEARRRRTALLARLAATGVAAALALAALYPGVLGRAERSADALRLASSGTSYVPTACDQPRLATFAAARPCASPGVTDVAALDRRYARQ
jgi:hypothetical protein